MIDKVSNLETIEHKARAAFDEASRAVVRRAKLANTEVLIWRDGCMVRLSPDEAQKHLDLSQAENQRR